MTFPEKITADYSGLNFTQIEELPLDDYLLYLRDGYIYRLLQTESGKEYLEQCWLSEQTKPDRAKLREVFGGGR